ncbi:MAG: NAD-dependent epimerase/dehydratase family protein [Candidatus Eisenbacteria bacterium]|nr:NAD-dependent epimerase/dehydratase family protein [Candidatus Eisenbacteria bacterium]
MRPVVRDRRGCKMAVTPQALKGWRVLLLGGTGLIGAHVARSLQKRGAQLRVLIRRRSRCDLLEDLSGVEYVTGDLHAPSSLEAAMSGCQMVIHAAAPYPTRATGAAKQIRRAERSMHNVLEAARRFALPKTLPPPLGAGPPPEGMARLVYVSSPTTIAPPPAAESGKRAANEDDVYDTPPNGAPYFIIKEQMERQARAAARDHRLPVVIVNPTLVVGAYDAKPTTGQFIIAVARRRMPFLLEGNVNVVPGHDVGEGVVLAGLYGIPGQRYILGGENMTVADLTRRIAMATGVQPPTRTIPMPVAQAVSWLTEGLALFTPQRPPLFPMNALQMLRRSQPLDTSRAVQELGWRKTPVDDAILRAVEWLRNEGRF